jgi:hypothetical protein
LPTRFDASLRAHHQWLTLPIAQLALSSCLFPADYRRVAPRTWVLPREASALLKDPTARDVTLILKPDGGSQGAGIALVQGGEAAVAAMQKAGTLPGQEYVLQEYAGRPALLGGKKFDLRLYALVTSLRPLRAFLATEGLVLDRP